MIAIRSARESDAARIAAIYAPYVTGTTISFEEIAPDAAAIAERMRAAGDRYPWLVASADASGELVGYAYATQHRERAAYRWSVDVSVYLNERVHRRGIASKLYASLFDILGKQGYVNAYAGVTQPNPASVAFHRAMGFDEIGTFRAPGYKFGAWHDVTWFGRALAKASGPPTEPKRLSMTIEG
jgi:phosphinothricin acetyltransferase